MNNTETLTTSVTQDTGQNKQCCSFLIVPSVYSSVYFVLCLVYPMWSVSLCCSFLIVPSVYSSVYFVLCLMSQDKINTRVNRRNNTETLTTLDTQDKINIRVNRRNNTETLTTLDTQDKINTIQFCQCLCCSICLL
jgi:hypothetical protein